MNKIRTMLKRVTMVMPYLLVAVSFVCGIFTYLMFTKNDYFGASSRTIIAMINIDLVLLLLLTIVVSRKLVKLWFAKRKGSAGSQIHLRLLMLFGILSITPSLVMTIFSGLFFHLGLQSWFSERIARAINNSVAIIEAYLQEHVKLMRNDALLISQYINSDLSFITNASQPSLSDKLTEFSLRHFMPEGVIFEYNGSGSQNIIARSSTTMSLDFELVDNWKMEQALDGQVVVWINEAQDKVRCLIALNSSQPTLLYLGRFVDLNVMQHRDETLKAVSEYNQLKDKQSYLEVRFNLIFVLVALLLLMVAILIGINFANRLTSPIRRLILASQRISKGELGISVAENKSEGELLSLSQAFNKMARQLSMQRAELISANKKLNDRRQFTESVLGGVSAGVIGLDIDGLIRYPNQSASKLLSTNLQQHVGQNITEIVPVIGGWFEEVRQKLTIGTSCEGEITITKGHNFKNFHVRLVLVGENQGYVLTFDDVTDFVEAQRKAAWSDVARRVAHEIKNPLTPIQLAAERIQRKYGKEITSDAQVFSSCIDTIIKQVGYMQRMVNEFSNFARMPKPDMAKEDIRLLCREAILMQRNAHCDIQFTLSLPERPVWVMIDRRLIMQAIINLVQNSVDAIYEKVQQNINYSGKVKLTVQEKPQVSIVLEDNGAGFSKLVMERITEPYITTKKQGTGLGLAIVKKIMIDHGGSLELSNKLGSGAKVKLIFFK